MNRRKHRPSKRRARGGKAGAQTVHATRRFRQRSIEVSGRDLEVMVAMIQRGEGTFVRRSTNRISIWELDYEGAPRRVVYDRNRHTIVTVLTGEA